VLFLRELREKQQVSDVTFLVDDAHHLENALDRLGLRFRYERRGNRNSVERIFCEVNRRTYSFSNTFSNAQLPTAKSWLQAFAVWWNRCDS
jgi:putative transposase